MVKQLEDCFTGPCIDCLEPLAQSVQQSLNNWGARSPGRQLLSMGDLCQEIFYFPQMAHGAWVGWQGQGGYFIMIQKEEVTTCLCKVKEDFVI